MTHWQRSTYCNLGDCAEVVRHEDGTVWLRSSLRPDEVCEFDRDEWAAFVTGIKAGEFDEVTA